MEFSEERARYAAERLNELPFAKLLGMRLTDIRPNEATVEIAMRDDLRQPSGVLHGGVTATLIDTAMAFAVRTYLDDTEPTATIDLTVHYLRPLVEGKAICTAASSAPANASSPSPQTCTTITANSSPPAFRPTQNYSEIALYFPCVVRVFRGSVFFFFLDFLLFCG